MSEDARGREHLDLAIDRAVREMVDIEPPANLRANVIARIEQPSALGSHLSAFAWLRFGGLAAAAAVLVFAIVLARRSEPTVQPRTVAQASDARLPGPVESSPQVHPAAPRAFTAAVSRQSRIVPASSTVAAVSAAGASDAPTDIEPLKTITPIAVEPIGETSIAPEPIAVRPLNPITEVQIAPLTPPDRRD